jgi:predicted ATPase
MNKIISIEGTWAAGKTSIIRLLGEQGENVYQSVVPEIYRAKGGSYSPREDPKDFTNLFLSLKDEQFSSAIKSGIGAGFFDRVFFAPIVLRRLLGLSVPGEFYELAKNADICRTVFLVEPIPLEMHRDGWPRPHFSYEESLRYQKITEDVVRELGFNIYHVKYSTSTQERARDILQHIKDLERLEKSLEAEGGIKL